MGVHRVTSEAAKAYAARERALGNGIVTLGLAAERISTVDKRTLEKCGDLAAELLPYSPGYVGKTMLIIARLFWACISSRKGDESDSNRTARNKDRRRKKHPANISWQY